MTGCVSGKRRFASRNEAKRAMRSGRGKRARHVSARIVIYRCPDCGGWHFTCREKG